MCVHLVLREVVVQPIGHSVTEGELIKVRVKNLIEFSNSDTSTETSPQKERGLINTERSEKPRNERRTSTRLKFKLKREVRGKE
jgi:hypothetical protein